MSIVWLRMDRMAWLALVVAVAGCSSSSGGQTNSGLDNARVRTMSSLYKGYLSSHKNQSPPDEAAFRAFLGTKQDDLQKSGLTTDDVFISPRDGQPLQWIFGKNPRPSIAGMQYIAYEKTPKDDKRLVVATGGMIELMDEARFRTVFPKAQ
jgi:hypothetical protein